MKIDFVVALYYNNELFCTGFMISSRDAVTIAECLSRFFTGDPYDFTMLKARIGIRGTNPSEALYAIKELRVHDKYNFWSKEFENNLAVVKVLFTTYMKKD